MYGLRRIAVRLAGSCSPYLSTVHKPRLLTTSTPSILRSSRTTQDVYFRRAFTSAVEKDASSTRAEASQGEVAEATSGDEKAALPSQETPQGLEETTTAESAEPLQPETTSAEAFNVGEVDAVSVAAPGSGAPASSTPVAESIPQPAETTSAAVAAGTAAQGTEAMPNAGTPMCLYIGNLFFEVTEDDIRRHFEPYGKVMAVNVIRDLRGVSRGYGFVEFANPDDAQRARAGEDSQPFRGRRLAVRTSMTLQQREQERAAGRGPRGWFNRPLREPGRPSRTLFVGNLSYDMSDRDLNELFRDVRGVLDVRVAIDRQSGQPRGFAHADFTDTDSATAAKAILETKTPHGRRVKVDYSTSRGRTEEGADAE